MSSTRWKEITPSEFPWEREALNFIHERLPDRDPYMAWSNFEFVGDDGSINEVDLLVVTPGGFFLVEIKSRPGTLRGDFYTWVWEKRNGSVLTTDSPVMLTNRKAKKLVSLLRRQKAFAKQRCPYLDVLVFCSDPDLRCRLDAGALFHVCLRDREAAKGQPARPGIMAAMINRKAVGLKADVPRIGRPAARAISRAMEQIGIRPSQSARRVGDYKLGKLLFESADNTYQDWEATHISLTEIKRRIRIYNVAMNTSSGRREQIRKAAFREFRFLEHLDHEGILRVDTCTEYDLGPALVFRHDPDAVRLDHFLKEHEARLDVDMRLGLVRQIAETLGHAHKKNIVHRSLSPQCILVTDPNRTSPKIRIHNWLAGKRIAGTISGEQNGSSSTFHPEQFVDDVSLVYMAPEALTNSESREEDQLDIFSLGAIAYHIFSGQAPASSALELNQKLAAQKGLDISSVTDGAGKELQDLIRYSTHPDITNRFDMGEFLEQLELVEAEFTEPDENVVENPLEAKVGDRLHGGFSVIRRLGSGSCSVAFFVEQGEKKKSPQAGRQAGI